MRKITVGFFVAIVAMLFVVGCSPFGAAGNPSQLTGTWTGSTSPGGQSTAGNDEGTWVSNNITYPTPASSTTDLAGVTDTTYYNTTTTEVLDTSVVAADGSWVETVVTTTTDAARAAIAAVVTGTSQTAGFAAILAGSKTVTVTSTGTVTPNIDGSYQVREAQTYSALATGSYIGAFDGTLGTNLTAVSQSVSGESTNANVGFPNYATPGLQTVTSASGGLADTTYSLVIAEDGTYTLTTTTTTTVTLPTAGTTVATTVETGTVLGSGIGSGGADYLTFTSASTATTFVGTGSLIQPSYPATAYTLTSNEINTNTWSYFVTKGGSDSFLQIFSLVGFSWPTLTLS